MDLQGWSFWRLQGSIGSRLFQLLEAPHPWLAAPSASSQPAAQHLPSRSASDPPASVLQGPCDDTGPPRESRVIPISGALT